MGRKRGKIGKNGDKKKGKSYTENERVKREGRKTKAAQNRAEKKWLKVCRCSSHSGISHRT